eukprot:8784242-Karenia_brevis.AAC.1
MVEELQLRRGRRNFKQGSLPAEGTRRPESPFSSGRVWNLNEDGLPGSQCLHTNPDRDSVSFSRSQDVG